MKATLLVLGALAVGCHNSLSTNPNVDANGNTFTMLVVNRNVPTAPGVAYDGGVQVGILGLDSAGGEAFLFQTVSLGDSLCTAPGAEVSIHGEILWTFDPATQGSASIRVVTIEPLSNPVYGDSFTVADAPSCPSPA